MSFTFKGQEVYPISYIKSQFSIYRYKTQRQIVSDLHAPPAVVMYACKRGYNWALSDEKYKGATPLILKKWADSNIRGLVALNSAVKITTKIPIKTYTKSVAITTKYAIAPELLELDDSEKFRDSEGNIVEIEVRGVRERKGCYFRAIDIEKMLNMKDLKGTIINVKSAFERERDFVTFQTGSGGVFRLFLTYTGMVRLLFVRRHPIADLFQTWAIDVLFSLHIAGAPLLSMQHSNESMYEFWKQIATISSVVYLFELGTFGALKHSLEMNNIYDDSWIVVKYGQTTDLEIRTKQHIDNYGRLPGALVVPRLQAKTDCRRLIHVEQIIQAYMIVNGYKIDHAKYKELAVVPFRLINTTIAEMYTKFEVENKQYFDEAIAMMAVYSERFA